MKAYRPISLDSLSVPALVGLASLAPADVWVVDAAAGPGHDFTDIQAAVDAATGGDTILVRTGTYPAFTVDGKALVLVEEEGAAASADGAVVRNLSAGQGVVARGIAFAGSALASGEWLRLENNQGPVWLEGCSTGNLFAGATTNGVVAVDSEDVVFLRCGIAGSSHQFAGVFGDPSAGGEALRLVRSDGYAFDSTFTGGSGTAASTSTPAFEGGGGIEMSDSFLFLSGCEVSGGTGGSAYFDPSLGGCHGPPKPGGAGLVALALPTVIRYVDSNFTGGLGGTNAFFCLFNDAPDGLDVEGAPGSLVELPGTSRSLEVSSPVRDDEALELVFTAPAGEQAFALLSAAQEPVYYPVFSSAILSPLASLLLLPVGAVPAEGELSLQVAAPAVPSAGALTFFAQSIFLDASPAAWVGGGSQLTILDAVF